MSTTNKEFNARNGAVVGTSSANYLQLLGSGSTFPVQILAQGSDTNISIELKPKGTGTVNIATTVTNTSTETATAFIPTGSTVPVNGLYLPATNTIGLSSNTTERLRIDASGNVLIGTTTNTNSSKLVVNGVIESTSGLLASTQLQYLYSTSAYPTVRPSLSIDFMDTNVLDPRISFTRSTIGTYYDNKTTSLAEQNLLTNSLLNASTAWIVQGSAIGAATAAPDGSTTAYPLIENTTSTTRHGIFYTFPSILSSSAYTFSIYIKNSAGSRLVRLCLNGYAGTDMGIVDINPVTGAVVQTLNSGTITGTIAGTPIAFPNRWFRISVTTTVALKYVTVALVTAGTGAGADFGYQAYTGDNASGILVWGAQIENRSAALSYVGTSGTSISNYIPTLLTAAVNTPRFDYDPVTKVSKGLIVEGGTINYVLYSNTSNMGTTSNSTLTFNAGIAPDGTFTATLFSPTAVNGFANVPYPATSHPAGTMVTYSIFMKNYGMDYVTYFVDGGSRTGVTINLSTMTTYSLGYTGFGNLPNPIDVTYTPVGNGWYRFAFTYMSWGFDQTIRIRNLSPSVIANGFSGVLLWGAQMESGSNIAIRTSTLGTGSTTTNIVLDAGASAVDGTYVNAILSISGYVAYTITAYVGSTKTATVGTALVSAPTSGRDYSILPGTLNYGGTTYTTAATSYIPTTTQASSRGADLPTISGTNFSSWYNGSAGTLLVDYIQRYSYSTGYLYYPVVVMYNSNTPTQSQQVLLASSNGNGYFEYGTAYGSSANSSLSGLVVSGNKSAISYAQNSVIAAVNGGTQYNGSSNVYDTPSTLNSLRIGTDAISRAGTGLSIRKLVYYPINSTSAAIQGLTTL